MIGLCSALVYPRSVLQVFPITEMGAWPPKKDPRLNDVDSEVGRVTVGFLGQQPERLFLHRTTTAT